MGELPEGEDCVFRRPLVVISLNKAWASRFDALRNGQGVAAGRI